MFERSVKVPERIPSCPSSRHESRRCHSLADREVRGSTIPASDAARSGAVSRSRSCRSASTGIRGPGEVRQLAARPTPRPATRALVDSTRPEHLRSASATTFPCPAVLLHPPSPIALQQSSPRGPRGTAHPYHLSVSRADSRVGRRVHHDRRTSRSSRNTTAGRGGHALPRSSHRPLCSRDERSQSLHRTRSKYWYSSARDPPWTEPLPTIRFVDGDVTPEARGLRGDESGRTQPTKRCSGRFERLSSGPSRGPWLRIPDRRASLDGNRWRAVSRNDLVDHTELEAVRGRDPHGRAARDASRVQPEIAQPPG